jgi:hypothetical protein
MKALKYFALTGALGFLVIGICAAQVQKNDLLLGLGYYNDNNQVMYLKANAKAKIDGKFQQVSGIPVSFYIGSENAANLLGKKKTDDHGLATIPIPASAKDAWTKSPTQGFLVVSDSSVLYNAVTGTMEITKARIQLDTAENKKIIALLEEKKGDKWIPVKGIDMKVGIKRMGSELNVTETPLYTTDSLGIVNADFTMVNLPGDPDGNLVLVARIEDNDLIGNISAERIVPWGAPSHYVSAYDKRSLFARAGRSPLWLLWMAATITLSVWLVIFYLFFQIRNMKKLGA